MNKKNVLRYIMRYIMRLLLDKTQMIRLIVYHDIKISQDTFFIGKHWKDTKVIQAQSREVLKFRHISIPQNFHNRILLPSFYRTHNPEPA